VALVIGNSTYRNVPTLPNPANDADRRGAKSSPADHVAPATGDGIDKRTGLAVIGGSSNWSR
jgi:hypothetical protein